MFNTEEWKAASFGFNRDGMNYEKYAGEFNFSVDNCQYEVIPGDLDTYTIPILIMWLRANGSLGGAGR